MTLSRRGPWRGSATSLAVMLMGAAWAGPATASPGVIDWPTYFRTGPSKHFVVLQELARGTVVDVQSCADQWCLVQVGRVAGYVDQANLGQQAPPSAYPAPAANATGCFDSRRAGEAPYRRDEVFRYCPR